MLHIFSRGRSDRFLRSLIFGIVALFSSAIATAAVACPDVSLSGQQISWSSDQLWQPRSHPVTAGGGVNLSGCSQPGVGWVATSPDFELNFSNNSAGRALELRAVAGCDVVLLVNDARGQWFFNDDGGNGSNSLISIPNAAAGVYDIWVGTFGSSTCSATLELETFGVAPGGGGSASPPPPPPPPPPPLAAACPDPGLNGQILTFNGQGLWVPQRFGVTAGGNVDLGACASVPGTGQVIQNADFTLNLTDNNQGYDLEFRTEGAGCDTVLLVNDAFGQWSFNDDDGGLTSRLRLNNASPGQYDIWVGTFGSANCQSTLVLETFGGQVAPPPPPPPPPPPTPTAALCPSFANPGQLLTFTGQQLWTPQSRSVLAGGNVDLAACPSVPGTGWVIENPDFTMNFAQNSQNYDLEFRTEGQGCDTVLLVNDATGQWQFNDDDGGLQSRLRLPSAPVGQYDIWVGTFGQQNCQTTLVAETFGGQVQQPQILPDPGNLTGFRGQLGQTLMFQVTGASAGTIWGTDVYSDDSSLSRAAVHAGAVQPGQTAVVQVMILPGQGGYSGTNRNGVQSSNYGSWGGSYRFIGLAPPPPPAIPAAQGNWRMNANGWGGTLVLNWIGNAWQGSITWDSTGVTEGIGDIRFDPSTNALSFTRQVPAASQAFQGFLNGNQLNGQFSVMGGPGSFAWSATR